MNYLRFSQASLLFLSLFASRCFASDQPTIDQAEVSVKAVLARMGEDPSESDEVREHTSEMLEAFAVRAVQACFPGVNSSGDEFVCLIDAKGLEDDFSVEDVPFRREGDKWIALLDRAGEIEPACPPREIAEEQLRQIKRSPKLRIADQAPESGAFSDERGMNRDKKGPLRLMCTYEALVPLGDEIIEQTLVTYVWRRDGRYTFDADVESWTN